MLDLDLALQLRTAGLPWLPTSGDRFVIPDRGMDEQVFVVSNVVVEVQDLPGGTVLGFNGTTEWALDSVSLPEVVWLPREGQLRELLADRFAGLEVVAEGFAVVLLEQGDRRRHVDGDAETAYARAVLDVLCG